MASEQHKRGQQIISPNEAAQRAKRLLPLDDFGLTWGGLVLPSVEATTHFCVVGATGSGKTTLLRLLMQSCLPLIGAEFKEKSYEVTHSRWEEPTDEECEPHRLAVAAHKALVSEREALLSKNRDEIEAVKQENRAIQAGNRSIQAANAAVEKDIARIEKAIKSVRFSNESTIGIVLGIAVIAAFIYLSPELFYFTPWIPYAAKIMAQIVPGCYAFVLFLMVIDKSARREKHNAEVRAQLEALKKEKDEQIAVREKSELNNQIQKEKPVPAPLALPYPSPVSVSMPGDKHVVTTERTAPGLYFGPGHRALIYDAKGDIVSLLYGMPLHCPIEILNPFDVRATAWDIARDITTPASARQLASILVPEEKNASQPFFTNSARDLIGQVIHSLIQVKPEAWTLRDLILATQTKKHLIALLEKTEQGKAKAETYFSDDRTASNILSEIATRMAPFESVAQAWSHAAKRISLTQWITGESILVLGSNEEHRAALDPINQVIFQRATELTLAQSESDTRRTWFFLDEVRDLKNLESLGRLMTKGRSKGVCVVLGFQDIEGMHDAFGKERANEFIGQCDHKAILRLNSPETAKWASELFGKYEFIEDETGENTGGSKTSGSTNTKGETTGETETIGNTKGTSSGASQGYSTSDGTSKGGSETFGQQYSSSSQWGSQEGTQTSRQTSEQLSNQTSESRATQTSNQSSTATNASDTESWSQTINKKRMEKDALLASQFTTIPVTNAKNGLHGYYLLPSIGAFYGVLDSAYVKGSLQPPDARQPNYIPRPPSQQYLKMWDKTELKELGLASGSSNRKEKQEDEEATAAAATPSEDSSKPPGRKLRNSRDTRWLPDTDHDSGLTRL